MDWILTILGPWTWWIIGVALLIAELLVPAIFFLWLAIAAFIVAIVDLVVPMSWQIEILVFSVVSAVLVVVGRPMLLNRNLAQTDQPHLNQRMHGYVGRQYVLEKAIENGRGQIRVDDTLWTVNGPELVKGARVEVTGVDGQTLLVRPVVEN